MFSTNLRTLLFGQILWRKSIVELRVLGYANIMMVSTAIKDVLLWQCLSSLWAAICSNWKLQLSLRWIFLLKRNASYWIDGGVLILLRARAKPTITLNAVQLNTWKTIWQSFKGQYQRQWQIIDRGQQCAKLRSPISNSCRSVSKATYSSSSSSSYQISLVPVRYPLLSRQK